MKDVQTIEVIAGKIDRVEGPVRDQSTETEYFDVELAAGKEFQHLTHKNLIVFIYFINGSVEVADQKIKNGQCAVFSRGDSVKISSLSGARFLFVAGEPLNEPVAWREPIVMNTEEELDKAFEELEEGTFIKSHKPTKLT